MRKHENREYEKRMYGNSIMPCKDPWRTLSRLDTLLSTPC